MQNERINNVFTLALLTAALAACSSPSPQLDSTFGDTVNAAREQQILNPDASRNTEPVVGLGGKAAKAVVTRYYKTYQSPPMSGNVYTIGVGTGTSGSAGGGGSSGGGMQ